MRKEFIGQLSNGENFSEQMTISLEAKGDRLRKWAECVLPMSDGMRSILMNPSSENLWKFKTVDGDCFDLTPPERIDVFAASLLFKSSGEVPGM